MTNTADPTEKAQKATEIFAPEGIHFEPVSSALIKIRRLVVLIWALIILGGGSTALVLVELPKWLYFSGWGVLGALILLYGWLFWLVGRQVKSLGYAQTETELLIKRGFMFRTLVAVPYGRMQYVDVKQGPLMRFYNVAELELHTGAQTVSATLPGLEKEKAAQLRERLTALGEAKMAGL